DEAEVLFAEARALAERAGDLRSLALLVAAYSGIKQGQGDVPSFVALAFESLHMAEQTDDPILIGTMYDSVIWAHAIHGRFAKAEEAHTKAVTLLGVDPTAGIDLWGMSSLLSVTHVWIYVLAWTGRLGEAERELRHACEVAKQHQQLDMLCWMEAATVYLARL